MSKIVWSKESVMAWANNYTEKVKYVCENCKTEVTLDINECPCCKERLEIEKEVR